MDENALLDSKLTRLVSILEEAKEDRWAKHFGEALNLLKDGSLAKCKKHILGAYGGMGSVNDTTLNFVSDEVDREATQIKAEIYVSAKKSSDNSA